MLPSNSTSFSAAKLLVLTTAVILLFVTVSASSKETTPAPSLATLFMDTLETRNADETRLLKPNDTTSLTILVGNVILAQGNTIFKCDSCVRNDKNKTFEAWGNVHINDADTTDIYAGHLKYLIDRQIAYLDKNVKLTDRQTTLTTTNLEFNRITNIATYKNNGKVVNKKTTITSKEGVYYTDIKDAYFKKNVIVNDPAYYITTDSLLYNTNSQITRFIANTTIKDSSGSIVKTKEGFYNLKTGEAELGQRPYIFDGKTTTIIADKTSINNNIARAEGNAIVVDSARGTVIIGNLIFQNRNTEAVLATQKPLMIIKQDNDSIFVAADTLFSAKLTDLYGVRSLLLNDTSATATDSATVKARTAKQQEKTDSTNRYFEAFRNVRIFSDSLQAVSDSLFYSFKDSTFRLYKDPVVWGNENQITGDTIYLHTKNKKPEWIEAFDNGLMINHLEKEAYNQIKATRIDGRFSNGELDSVRAKGSAHSIYFLRNEDSTYTGINEANSDIIDIYIITKELHKVAFRSEVKGTVWPIKQKSPTEMRVPNFQWHETRRPKTKFELMQ